MRTLVWGTNGKDSVSLQEWFYTSIATIKALVLEHIPWQLLYTCKLEHLLSPAPIFTEVQEEVGGADTDKATPTTAFSMKKLAETHKVVFLHKPLKKDQTEYSSDIIPLTSVNKVREHVQFICRVYFILVS